MNSPIWCLPIVLLAAVVPCTRSEMSSPSPRAVALKFVSALFLDHDIESALQFVDKNAVRKSREPGSLSQSLRQQPVEQFKQTTLNEIIFFTKADVPKMRKRYPDDMWDRLEKKLDDGLGCLSVLDVGEEEHVGLMAILIKSVDGQTKVVYSDDN